MTRGLPPLRSFRLKISGWVTMSASIARLTWFASRDVASAQSRFGLLDAGSGHAKAAGVGVGVGAVETVGVGVGLAAVGGSSLEPQAAMISGTAMRAVRT